MRRIAAALGTDRPELEASGGLRAETLADVAGTGVDLVSLGSLTHSVRAIDLSFLIEGA
jgi:nicotinate-nucleotide pyrophosphorylase (carboxylating)